MLLIHLQLVKGFVSAGGNKYNSRSQKIITTELRGGYDATIGVDPSAPIQFFAMPGMTCPYAQRTHIALKELGLPFDFTEISDVKADWYLRINPRGKVPAIRIPNSDFAIYESAICNEFLCDYSSTSLQQKHQLMPVDPLMRAKIRLLNDHCDNVFAKTQFTFLMNKDVAKDETLCNEMETALSVYENALVESGGPYLIGQDFTIADVHVLPFLKRLVITLKHWKNYQIPEEKFPKLLAWLNSCLERESVKETSMTDERTIETYKRFVEADYKFGGLNKN